MDAGPPYLPALLAPLAASLLLVAALVAALTGRRGYWRLFLGAAALVVAGRVLYTLHFLLLDYRLAEVVLNASDGLTLYYRIAASWSGSGGSLYTLAAMMAAALAVTGYMTGLKHSRVFVSISSSALLVGLATSFLAGAFSSSEVEGGIGINPLLKNFWAVPHPLLSFSGYAVSAAGALAFWVKPSREALVIVMLGLGLTGLAMLFGGLWSYETFGWGGYWAWDPVEVAQLSVFLAAAAFIHLRGPLAALAKPYSLLVVSTAALAVYVTRSGLSPLHSFAGESLAAITYLILASMLLIAFLYEVSKLSLESLARGLTRALSSPQLLGFAVAGLTVSAAHLIVYATLLAPSLATVAGTAWFPAGVEAARFYTKLLLPLALLGLAGLPLYFLAGLGGWRLASALVVVGVSLSALLSFAASKGYVDLLPRAPNGVDAAAGAIVPLSVVALVSLILGAAASKGPKARVILERIVHAGLVITLLGAALSGSYSFSERYFEEKIVPVGGSDVISGKKVEVVDVNYEFVVGGLAIRSFFEGTPQAALAEKSVEVLASGLGLPVSGGLVMPEKAPETVVMTIKLRVDGEPVEVKVRYEVNGELLGIRGLVVGSATIPGPLLGDIYVRAGPGVYRGEVNSYPSLLAVYLALASTMMTPAELAGLAALIASGMVIGAGEAAASPSLIASTVVDMMSMLQEPPLTEVVVAVKEVPFVDLVWLGGAITALSTIALSLLHAAVHSVVKKRSSASPWSSS